MMKTSICRFTGEIWKDFIFIYLFMFKMKWPETRNENNEIISETLNYLIYIIWDWCVQLWMYMFTIKLIKCDSNSILGNFNAFKNSVLCTDSSKSQLIHQF